jgi:spermidine synthase
MENEWSDGGSQEFDVLLIDAFSGDSIPIHLLTVEALELYDNHLKDKGVIAIHVSNLHLNLSDLVHNLADKTGWTATRVEFDPNYEQHMLYYSDWILLSKDPVFHDALEQDGYSSYWYEALPKDLIWTDDYSNLFGVIDWEE